MVSNIELRVPRELEFMEFLEWVKQTHEERILRDQFNPPHSIYSYSRKNRIITSYFHTSDDPYADKLIENNPYADKLIENITNDGYSAVITKKWRALIPPIITKMIENSEFDKSKELMILIGKGNDRKGTSKSSYYIVRSAPSDDTAKVIYYELLPGAQFESAVLNETNRPMFYCSKIELPIPIPEDLLDNIHYQSLFLKDYDFQQAVIAIHTRISNIARKNPHWKIVDIDYRTELSLEEVFDKYYAPYVPRFKIQDFGKCKICNQPLKRPFYQFYRNDITGQDYKGGPINGSDEYRRYHTVADRKCKEALPYSFKPSEVVLPSKTAYGMCSACQDSYITSNVIQLHLTPDSANPELDEYIAQLIEIPKIPLDGYFGLGIEFDINLQHNLDLAFAEENSTLNETQQIKLESLLNNFIKEKGRRYPDDNELIHWLNDAYISHSKIFDMRGLNYFWHELLIRFVVIIHLTEETVMPWLEYLISDRSYAIERW